MKNESSINLNIAKFSNVSIRNLLACLAIYNIGYWLFDKTIQSNNFYLGSTLSISAGIIILFRKMFFITFPDKLKVDDNTLKLVATVLLALLFQGQLQKITVLPVKGIYYYNEDEDTEFDGEMYYSKPSPILAYSGQNCKISKEAIFINLSGEASSPANCLRCVEAVSVKIDKFLRAFKDDVDRKTDYCNVLKTKSFLFVGTAIFKGYDYIGKKSNKFILLLQYQFETLSYLTLFYFLKDMIIYLFRKKP